MWESVSGVLERAGFSVVERVDLPGREARHAALPVELHPRVQSVLSSRFAAGVYAHQAAGIQALLGGRDVCLATSTASGKSLVFMAFAAHLLLSDPKARVLAFYPAKALIQDQLDKWSALMGELDLGVGHIDGGVSVEARDDILRRNRIVLMTPDVAHAWLMSRLEGAAIRRTLSSLRLTVLDEAHVYEGVFGTNMAYFLRRFQAVAGQHQLVCSTATLNDPAAFLQDLTGRDTLVIGDDQCGARRAARRLGSIRSVKSAGFERVVELVKELATSHPGRFLVFADSRRMVELVVAALPRDDEPSDTIGGEGLHGVLPYRAGYEEADRQRIQQALRDGSLRGVVSTSALELGLDIGEIDLVLLLGVAPTMKAFWQRVGRAGRRGEGVCLILDEEDRISAVAAGLDDFLARPVEPSWLYLENRYIQYAHALCAAVEQRTWSGTLSRATFETVPATFPNMVANEVEPRERVAPDLYPLKQRTQGDPHHQFPLRSGIEPTLKVEGPFRALGGLTWSQVLREAYPGAIYHYMACPYRIVRVEQRRQRVEARREKRGAATKPVSRTMAFPSLEACHALWRLEGGFLAEAPMQVSEQVLGFREIRGKSEVEHRYGPESSFSQRELNRFFETTGVCWFLPDPRLVTEEVADSLLSAFSLRFGVQRTDLGVGPFFVKESPLGSASCRGVCVYDGAHGSLRLTQRLADRLDEVLDTARAQAGEDQTLASALEALAAAMAARVPMDPSATAGAPLRAVTDDTAVVIASGQVGMHVAAGETREVRVLGWRYTPRGLMYQIESSTPGVRESVPAEAVQAIRGVSQLVRVNLTTGELMPD